MGGLLVDASSPSIHDISLDVLDGTSLQASRFQASRFEADALSNSKADLLDLSCREPHGRRCSLLVRIRCSPAQFAHGQRQGVGRWKSKEGLEYVGEWRAGHMSGVGQSTHTDGTSELSVNKVKRKIHAIQMYSFVKFRKSRFFLMQYSCLKPFEVSSPCAAPSGVGWTFGGRRACLSFAHRTDGGRG